jgi:hypothetical protein
MFFAAFGGIYAVRALALLFGNPEMLKIQRRIWLPILTGGGFFTVAGLLHLVLEASSETPVIRILYESFEITGYALLAIGIYRFWRLQATYNRVKREALQRINHQPAKSTG